MTISIKHAKTNNIADWTQADLDAQIALGNFPPGTVLNDIPLPSDWNAEISTSMATGKLLGRSTAGTGSFEEIAIGSGLSLSGGSLSATGGGAGTVTTVSVTSANGFSGSVANATTTPAITLSTTITGVLKGNGTAISAAVSGTDYAPATSGSAILKGNGAGGFSSAAAGTDYCAATSGSGILKGSSGNTATATAGVDYSAGTSALATGILKSTTTTGALSIAVAADFPTLNQNTTGSAATLTTPRAIYGNNFDGSAALTQVIASTYGGTGNGFTKFSGPATAEKTFTLPNASATILTDNAAVTVSQGGTGATTLTGVLKGNGTSAFTAATAGTDYCAATSGSSVLKGSSGNTTAATAGTDYVAPGTKTTFTAQQNFGTATLTDAATIAWNLDSAQVAKVTLGGNRTLGLPTNMVDGGTYILRVIQDGTGSRTLAYNAAFKWPSGTAPVLSTAAGAIDILTFISDGSNMYGIAQKGFA